MTQQTQTNQIEWKEVELKEILTFEPKSGKKAGDGFDEGKYKFFTSSPEQTKFIDNPDYEGAHLILSTGGKAAVHYCNENFSSSNDCFVVRVVDHNAKFLYFLLKSRIYLLEQGFKGAGLKHLSKSYLIKIKIPLPFSNGIPDLKEQERIVSILEKAEKLRERGQRAEELLDEYLKSVFYEMFYNKGFERKKGKEMFELAYGKGLPEKERDGGKYSVYGSNGVVGNHSKFLIKGPGIVIGRKGSIGKVNYSKDDFWAIDTTYYLIPFKGTNFIFLYYLLKSYNLKLDRSTAIPGLNRYDIYNMDFVDVPLSLQQKFASIVEQVEKMKENINKTKQNSEELFNSLMQKAFRGEL